MAVLITCALGAEAYKLKKQLLEEETILGDFADIPDIMLRSGQMIKLPNPTGTSYQHEMLALCMDKGIDIIYSLDATELSALKEALLLFSEYGILIKADS